MADELQAEVGVGLDLELELELEREPRRLAVAPVDVVGSVQKSFIKAVHHSLVHNSVHK